MGCSKSECYEPVHARTLCQRHYMRAYEDGKLDEYPVRGEIFVPVCVCPLPDPDGVGECRKCLMAYRPALMDLRDQWIAYLDGKGVKRGFTLVNG